MQAGFLSGTIRRFGQANDKIGKNPPLRKAA